MKTASACRNPMSQTTGEGEFVPVVTRNRIRRACKSRFDLSDCCPPMSWKHFSTLELLRQSLLKSHDGSIDSGSGLACLCLLFIHPPAHGSEVSPAPRNTLESARIPRASKLLICGLFQKGRVLAQDGVEIVQLPEEKRNGSTRFEGDE